MSTICRIAPRKPKATAARIKYMLVVLMAFTMSAVSAQIRFKKGDEIQRQILTRSNCVLQRGSQALHVSSYAIITKTCRVVDASDKGVSLVITTDKLIDTVNAMDQTLVYNSAKPADPNSTIQQSLQKLAGIRFNVSVNSKGQIITSARSASVSDTVLSFTGIQPENLSPGNSLQFVVNIPPGMILKKGYTWSAGTAQNKTDYTVYAVNSQTTTITYRTSIFGNNLNSRINGSLLVDNNTGIVLKRYSQYVSTGYEMVNGVVYTATRRTAITEVNTRR